MHKFVSQVAHDINNPVGNCLMYSQMMEELLADIAEGQEESQVRQVQDFNQNIKMALNNLTGIIDAWVIAQKIMDDVYVNEVQPMDVVQLLNSAVDELQIYTGRKKLEILKEWPTSGLKVEADQNIVKRVFENMAMLLVMFADQQDTLRFKVVQDESVALISMEDSYKDQRNALHARFTGDEPWENGEVLNEGVLKPAGYGLKFCGVALKYLDAEPEVQQSELGGLKFTFRLPLLQ